MSYKKILLSCILTLVMSFLFAPVPTPARADDYGLDATAEKANLKQYTNSVSGIAGTIIGTALSMISVIFFVLMIYGGFLWMTAHGDEGQVTKAQDTITAAVIGIVVILAAYAITTFVTTSVVSTDPNAQTPTPSPSP